MPEQMPEQQPIPRWLIDTLAHYRLDLTLPSWNLQTINEDLNLQITAFDTNQIALSIRDKIAEGIFDIVDQDFNHVSIDISKIHKLINSERHRLFLGLTKEGGKYWESISHPDWSKFVNWGNLEQSGDKLSMFIEGLYKDRINEVLLEMNTIGYTPDGPIGRWSVIAPWDATYWKVFPEGHRLEFFAIEEYKNDYSYPAPDWFSRTNFWYL